MVLSRILAIVRKDAASEFRTRFGITSLGLFVITTVSLVAFSTAQEPFPRPITAALLWIIMFFTAMTGLGRAFIQEEERGTVLFLRLHSQPIHVFWAKFTVNIVFAELSNTLAYLLLCVFLPDVQTGNMFHVLLVILVSSAGLAAVITIVSAIVARAGATNTLLPIMSFPLLLPLVIPGINAITIALAGLAFSDMLPDLTLMVSYSGIILVLASFLFEVVWLD